ncbi:esterase-like [Bolinopsis microptera]|uniref:esterase-like n=1 Tax=Bolinopsis microptera TaxID=2820187 RepID=UPI003078B8CC
MINSILFKMFKLSSVSYDFIIYHFITSLATAAATLISTLRLAPYHRVFRSVTKLLLLVPNKPFQTCSYRTEILEDVPLRIYTPSVIKSDVVIVYYHGGMFCYYSQAMYHTLMYTLAITNGCKVILCGQKLAPEFPFPNAVIEAYQVVNWVQTQDTTLSINKRRVIVMGDGSGAALASAVAILHQRHQGKSLLDSTADLQPPLAAQILIHPVLQGFSYGENSSLNPSNKGTVQHKSLYLSYYIAGNPSFSSTLGAVEGATDEYPKFWGSLIDDAVKTRDPISELKPSVEGIWNELAFPLMCADPSGLPSSLIVGYVQDQSFDDSRYFAEWLQYNRVPVHFIRELSGYHDNLLLHSISPSAKKVLQHVTDYIEHTVC